MGDIRITRDFFLWCMSVVYLFAFTSLFVQIPGLYGDNGILPARLVVQKEAESFSDLFTNQPSLLRLLPRIGLDVQYGMDFLCLGGIILSFVAMVIRSQRNCVTFFFLWAFYLSLFQVGQTFLWFQWDILLLEIGFLTVLVAPFSILRWPGIKYHSHDSITFWLVKWLLFRLMFASGIVKLTSQCPTWWGLTALNYHYETQCIPTPAAWWFHHLPEWFQKLSVVGVYIIEIPIPFLFFSPVRSQRLLAFYAQLLLQVMIIFTGNYNFFNLMTVVMCISLLDDNYIRGCLGKPKFADRDDLAKIPIIGPFWRIIRLVLNILVYGGLIFWTVKLFSLKVVGNSVESNVSFSYKDFDKVLKRTLPITIYMGVASLAWEILKALIRSLVSAKGIIKKLFATTGVLIFGAAAMSMFAISLVDHTVIEENAYRKLWPVLHKWHDKTNHFTLTSSYGLFRRMTGVGGRPEVIIEGSNNMNSGWKEYEFLYKPGNTSHGLPIVAPHQPRLDWQMWFAALGSYQHNPWFLNLVYRLLNGEKAVLELMGKNPFPSKPPKYIRAQLYHYYYTSNDKQNERYSATDWWTRTKVQEYLPILNKDEPSFLNYLKQSGLMDAEWRNWEPRLATGVQGRYKMPHIKWKAENVDESNEKSKRKYSNPDPTYYIKYVMVTLREILGQPEGFLSCVSIFVAGLVLTFLDPTVKLVEWPDS